MQENKYAPGIFKAILPKAEQIESHGFKFRIN